jgi:putative alpha-1,2-mannosidase
MSAWYLFSALGFYPVNPSSTQYVVGSPFFDKVTINLPGTNRPLVISSPGAPAKPFIRSLKVNGKELKDPIIEHSQLLAGGLIEFEMSDKPETWASEAVLTE